MMKAEQWGVVMPCHLWTLLTLRSWHKCILCCCLLVGLCSYHRIYYPCCSEHHSASWAHENQLYPFASADDRRQAFRDAVSSLLFLEFVFFKVQQRSAVAANGLKWKMKLKISACINRFAGRETSCSYLTLSLTERVPESLVVCDRDEERGVFSHFEPFFSW